MGEFIANTGRVITITPQGGWTPSVPAYVNIPAAKAKCGGLFALVQAISWSISGCTQGAFSGGGGGTMVATAQKVTADGQPVMRENDAGICSGVLAGPGPPITCICEFKIINAGQTKMKVE